MLKTNMRTFSLDGALLNMCLGSRATTAAKCPLQSAECNELMRIALLLSFSANASMEMARNFSNRSGVKVSTFSFLYSNKTETTTTNKQKKPKT